MLFDPVYTLKPKSVNICSQNRCNSQVKLNYQDGPVRKEISHKDSFECRLMWLAVIYRMLIDQYMYVQTLNSKNWQLNAEFSRGKAKIYKRLPASTQNLNLSLSAGISFHVPHTPI
jgi:hypothetical protein